MKRKTLLFILVIAVIALAISFDTFACQHMANAFSLQHVGYLTAPVAAATLPESIKFELDRIRTGCVEPIQELQAQVRSLEQIAASNDRFGAGTQAAAPSIGLSAVEALAEDASFKAAEQAASRGMKPSQFSARINLDGSIRAALVNDGAGGVGDTEMPSDPERRGLTGPVLRSLRLLDALPSRPTSSDSVEYVQLNVTGDAAEQEKEGDSKAELDFDGDLQTANIVTVAGWTTASKQVLSDQRALAQQIDRVIRHKVLSRLENRLINGTGGQGKINGLLNQATAFVPAIGTTPADVIGESLVVQANAGFLPNLVVMNPLDWFRLQITRNNETDNEYLFGSPTMPVPPVLWNTRIVTTPSIAEGTAMTIDTSYTTVLDREQLTVVASNTHADYFVRNLVAILGELRAGLEIISPAAVNKFTLPAPAP